MDGPGLTETNSNIGHKNQFIIEHDKM